MFSVAILHVILAIPALLLISLDKLSSKSQKGYQLLFAAFIPIVGPVIMIILNLYWRAKPSARKYDVGDSAEKHVAKHDPVGSWDR